MGAGPHAPVLWQRCQQGSEGHGWEQLTDRGQRCAMCAWFKTAEQAQQTEKRLAKENIDPPETNKVREESGLGGEHLSTHEGRCGVRPPLSAPPCLPSPLPPLAITRWLPLGLSLPLWFIGWARYPFVGASGPSVLIFHWNVARAPLFFSLGLDKLCQLPAGWPVGRILARSLTASPSQLCFLLLLFYFFSLSLPSLLSPSIMEKQFRFSRFTERGKGWGNTCSFSNKCFSSSPRPGNSSGGRWWGFQPASPSPWPQGCTYASIPSTGKGKKSGFELSNPNLYSLCWCVSLPQPRMEFIGYNLRANECFIALAPLKEAKCVLEASCLGAAGWKITLFFFLNTNNQQVFLAGRKECSVNAKIAINTSACRLKKSEMIYRYYGCRHIALRVFGRNGLSQWLGCIAVLLITLLQTAGSIWNGRKRCDMLRFKCQQLQKLVKLK